MAISGCAILFSFGGTVVSAFPSWYSLQEHTWFLW